MNVQTTHTKLTERFKQTDKGIKAYTTMKILTLLSPIARLIGATNAIKTMIIFLTAHKFRKNHATFSRIIFNKTRVLN